MPHNKKSILHVTGHRLIGLTQFLPFPIWSYNFFVNHSEAKVLLKIVNEFVPKVGPAERTASCQSQLLKKHTHKKETQSSRVKCTLFYNFTQKTGSSPIAAASQFAKLRLAVDSPRCSAIDVLFRQALNGRTVLSRQVTLPHLQAA